MSTQVSNAFITQWSDDVKHAYQQTGSKLRQAVRTVTGVTGDTYKFHKLGAATSNTKTRDAELTFINPTQSVATATLADQHSPIFIDSLDLLKTNIDFRQEYIKASAATLGRYTDDTIITALSASNTNTPTLSGGLTFAKILEALTKLNEVDADPMDRFLVVSPAQVSEALAISQLTSTDYMTLRGVVNGDISAALGFRWINSTRLVKNNLDAAGGAQNNTRHCFAIHKPAVGLAVGQDITSRIDFVPMRDGYLINSKVSLGAVVVEQTGVVEIGCQES